MVLIFQNIAINDNSKTGWHSMSVDDDHDDCVKKLHVLIHENHQPTIHKVVDEAGVSKNSHHTIFTKKNCTCIMLIQNLCQVS